MDSVAKIARQHPLRLTLLGISVALLVGLQVSNRTRPMPAQKWIAANLEKIQVEDPDDFYFAVFGDNRGSSFVFESILDRIQRDPQIAFAVAVGDLVHAGEKGNYRVFLEQVKNRLHKPLLTAIGNHELRGEGRRLYAEIFGPFYYSFQIGKTCFFVLDDADGDVDSQQRDWFREEVSGAHKCEQRLVFLHTPLYDPTDGRYDHCLPNAAADSLSELFSRCNVSHIFASHIHGWFEGEWAGIPFTISGGGGAALQGHNPAHYFFHYLKVHVRAGTLHAEVQSPTSMQYQRMGPRTYLAWLYIYPFLKIHGLELALLLVILALAASIYRSLIVKHKK